MYLLAIDPGGNSGLAIRQPDKSLIVRRTQSLQHIWDYFKPDEPKFDCVILEDWQYFDGIARPEGVLTAEICSSIKGICYVTSTHLSIRTPGSRTGYIDQAKSWMRKNRPGWRDNKINSHEVDALAHLLKWESEWTR